MSATEADGSRPQKTTFFPRSIQHFLKPRITLRHGLDQVDLSATETKGNVLIKNAAELLNYSKTEEDAMEKAVKEIAAVGVNVVVAQTTVRRGGAHPTPARPTHPPPTHPPTN